MNHQEGTARQCQNTTFLKEHNSYNNEEKRPLVQQTKTMKIYHKRNSRVIYELFQCAPNIPRGFITPVNPQKMRSIAKVYFFMLSY